MSNYPDNMDWGIYDDYHDPKLECGCRLSNCECTLECGCYVVDNCDCAEEEE